MKIMKYGLHFKYNILYKYKYIIYIKIFYNSYNELNLNIL